MGTATPGAGGQRGPRIAGAPAAVFRNLTRREVEVLGLMAAGRTDQQIRRPLEISEGTVKAHVKAICGKPSRPTGRKR
jgi:DNA-binding NarL/FixJ family response regulator